MNSSSKSKLVVRCFSVSADGYGAGPNQDVNNPLGAGGMALHEWVLPTRTLQKMLFGKDGGTTFHFVTDGIEVALRRAREAAGGKDVRLGGGVATIRQYLRAGLVDELHLAIAPILLGSGENLFAGIDMVRLGYKRTEHVATPAATHIVLGKA